MQQAANPKAGGTETAIVGAAHTRQREAQPRMCSRQQSRHHRIPDTSGQPIQGSAKLDPVRTAANRHDNTPPEALPRSTSTRCRRRRSTQKILRPWHRRVLPPSADPAQHLPELQAPPAEHSRLMPATNFATSTSHHPRTTARQQTCQRFHNSSVTTHAAAGEVATPTSPTANSINSPVMDRHSVAPAG
jgi:hypothetical protein